MVRHSRYILACCGAVVGLASFLVGLEVRQRQRLHGSMPVHQALTAYSKATACRCPPRSATLRMGRRKSRPPESHRPLPPNCRSDVSRS